MKDLFNFDKEVETTPAQFYIGFVIFIFLIGFVEAL
jgi:hypothetical protein